MDSIWEVDTVNIQDYLLEHSEVAELFEGLTKAQLSEVQLKPFKKGEYLAVSGEDDNNFYVILEGVADVMNDYETGERLACSKIARGDVIGFYGLLADGTKAQFTIVAHTPVLVAYIPREDAKAFFSTNPAFMNATGRRFVERLYKTSKLLAECGVSSLYHAAITYLLYSCNLYATGYPIGYTGPVRIDESRQNMADFLGVDVRSINRAIERLKKDNLVSIIKGKVHINALQLQKLEEVRHQES